MGGLPPHYECEVQALDVACCLNEGNILNSKVRKKKGFFEKTGEFRRSRVCNYLLLQLGLVDAFPTLWLP
jgi:hypothetical protein